MTGIKSPSKTFGEMDLSETLMHYGVLGMKWGRRKDRQTGEYRPSGKREKAGVSEDHTKARELLKQKASTLSNAQLQELNTRLQLERTYASLTKDKSAWARVNKGRSYADDIIKLGKTANQAYKLVESPLGQQLVKSTMKNKGRHVKL